MTNKFVCDLAWKHLSIMPHGVSSICCIADHSYFESSAVTNKERVSLKDSKIIDIVNSDSYKQIRLDMLNGIVPKACQGCKNIEDNGGVSKRMQDGSRYNLDHARLTKSDGSIDVDLMNVELRLGNYCNLKCRGCNAESSTSWVQDYYKLKDSVNLPSSYDLTIKDTKTDYSWCESEDFYNDLLANSKNLDVINISGGEPFLVPKHFEILQRLVDEGKTDVRIHYITNLNYNFDKLRPALQMLKNFKQVSISFSIDDIEDRNGYIRKNSDWELMMTNLKLFIDECPKFVLSITQTVMAYNFMYIEELYLYLNKHNLLPMFGIRLNHIHSPDYLNANVLPIEVRREKIDQLRDILPETMYKNLYGHYYNTVENNLWDEFIKTTIHVDVIRKETVFKLFPKLFKHIKENK